MGRERIDRWCERGILGILLAILVYGPLATGAVRAQDFLIIQWLTLILTVAWIIRLLVNPQIRFYWPPVCWLIVAFLVYAGARYWTADIEYVARQEWLRILVYTLIFFAFIQNIRKPEHLRLIGLVVICIGLFIALYAIVQYVTVSDKVWHFHRPPIYARRGSGTYINPNHMAGYLEMILPMALVCAVGGRFSTLTRVIIGYAALVVFMGILVSFSRGGWIACAAGLLPLFIWLLRRRIYRWQGFALLIALLAIGLTFIAKAKMSPNRQGELNAFRQGENIRLLLWKPTWEMFLDHPVWGVGPDHFDLRFREYRPEHPDLQVRPDRAHNDYLNALADWGIMGGLLIFSIPFLFYRQLMRHWKYTKQTETIPATSDSADTALIVGGTLGLLAILVHSFFDFNMHIPANAILATTLGALLLGCFQCNHKSVLPAPNRFIRLGAIAVLCLCSVYLGVQSWGKSHASIANLKADDCQPCSDNQISLMEAAFHQEPKNFESAYQIGLCWRLRSWQNGPAYKEAAKKAIEWFDISTLLNPYDPYSLAEKGMCLDWLNEHAAAEEWYQRAIQVDPNGYYINALVGWHYLQAEDYQEAKRWFERSLKLFPNIKNFIASYYLGRVNEMMAERKGEL